MSETLIYTTHTSPIGKLLLVASRKGLRYVTILADVADVDAALAQVADGADFVFESHGFLATACTAIDEYLKNGIALKLPVDLNSGTALQRAVWLQIAKVPHGETISYTTLADRVGFPRAIRAVASACGANPILLVVPCHRILAKDGTLGGYSGYGGLELKRRLLTLEAGEDWQAAVA